MSYDALGAAALDYAPCKYPNSRLQFRGPERRLDAPYVAFLGGTETYGKFIKAPFPALVESSIGVNCVNFGIINAGVDVFIKDSFLSNVVNGAEATILQVVGAQNLSNRFYTVHPRRNDRFLKASPLLRAIYPEVDFSEFHFTRHMLSALYAVSSQRFTAVRRELQKAWTSRMKLLCGRLSGKKVLLWFSDHAPPQTQGSLIDPTQDRDPLFVTRKMLDALSVHFEGYVEATASSGALEAGTTGMVFSEMETLAAHHLMGPYAHGEAAETLTKVLEEIL